MDPYYNPPKTALVTGATSGVGLSIARSLAKQKHQVVMLSHDKKKAEKVRDKLITESSNSKIDIIEADLSSLASVRSAVNEFKVRHGKLHVLSNNAAVLPMNRQFTKDHYESIFGINYLSHFLLTNLLLDLLKRSAPSRIIHVAGGREVIQKTQLNFEDLQSEEFNPFRATLQAALAKTMFSTELARRLKGTGVTSNAFHPGFVRSDLGRNLPWYFKWGYEIVNLLLSRDSKTGIYVATAPEIERVSGSFFSGKKAYEFNPKYVRKQDYERLWGVSAKLAGI